MRRIAGALLLALIASTCVATPSPSGPTERVPARALGGQPMRECAVGATLARCGSLLVAVDPSRPEGRRVDLRVVVVPATDATTRPAALFLVTGGPGGASTSSFAWAGGLRRPSPDA